MANSHAYNSSDADSVVFAGASILGTTAAASTTVLTLTQDRRQINITNGTNGTVFICRRRKGDTLGVAKEIAMLLANGTATVSLKTNGNGYSKDDVITAYAASAPTGSLFVAAQ